MAGKRSKHSSQHELSPSTNELARLLAVKVAETDRRLASAFSQRCEQLQFQDTLVTRLGAATDMFELSRLILREAVTTFGASQGMLAMVTETQFLEVMGTTSALPQRYMIDLLEECFIVGETLSLASEDATDLHTLGNADLPAGVPLLAVPLFQKDGRPMGALVLEGTLRANRQAWLDNFLVTVAAALEDCRHYNKIDDLIMDAVMGISTAFEARTPQQAGHTRRVEDLALQISRGLGLTPSQERRVRMTALLHDMEPGAISAAFSGIKRGKLTAHQWQAWMADPFVGGIYASPIANFQRVVNELHCLRSRWDGKGNNPPLVGDEIPLAARIVAVAEAFENLTGGRWHRTTLGIPDALVQLRRYAGAQYDPAAVDALCRQYAELELEARIARINTKDAG